MLQATNPAPFPDILDMPGVIPAGRWQAITYDAALPAGVPGERIPVYAVSAAIALAEGTARLRYAAGASPAIVCTTETNGREGHIAYRLLDHSVVSTSMMNQPPAAAIVLGASILAANADAAYADAHLALVTAIEAAVAQPAADEAAVRAGVALLEAIKTSDHSTIAWFANAKTDAGELDEAVDPAATPLDALFASAASFTAYRAGEPTEWELLRTQRGSDGPAQSGEAVDPAGFVGPQKDAAVRFMREGKHILHHGPTGTGKSFVWDIAMKEIHGDDFDPNSYPYFVHGSAGVEDIDFIGSIIPMPDGTKQWVDGPLVRAMRDGKRLKVEELNRMPSSMLNVLLGAMDYGRIAITRHLGEVVVAAPGFAVDAMANIGREYTGTEIIDAAIMRRFTRKIEYDFLAPDREVALLRSRQPALDPEDAETLVRIANTVREAYEYGNGDLDVDLYVSPAALLETADAMARGAKLAEAIESTWLSEVAQTKAKREKVRAMIETHLRERKRPRRKSGR